jgi:methyl-accepting chemotaxis protein/DNA-binding transcriptional regulator YdaS (Cro superfamily)
MRVPLRHSLTGRLLFFGVLPMMALTTVILVIGITEKFATLQGIGESKVLQTVQFARSLAEDRFNDAARTSRLVAEATAAGLDRDPEAMRTYLRSVVERDGALAAAWIVVTPSKDRTIAMRASRSSNDEPAVVTDDPLLTTEPLYIAAMQSEHVHQAIGGEPIAHDGRPRLEFAYAITRDGQRIGAAGTEYELGDPQAAAEAIASQYGVRLFVLSPSKVVLAASDGATGLVGQRAAETALAPLFRNLDELVAGNALAVVDDPITGRPAYVGAARTPTLGAYLVLTKPVGDITAPIYSETIRNAVIAGLGFLVVAGLIIVMSLAVRRRMDNAVRLAATIAGGDLGANVPNVVGNDESSALLRSLDEMASQLRGLVGEVRTAAATLDGGVGELGRVTDSQRAVVLPLGQGVSEVTAAAQQISTTGVELSETMRSLEASASSTAGLADAGRANLASVNDSMRELDVASASVAEKLATINEKAVAINGVVTTITKVADQTNILSVNAAIEAEKAGEYGRGFLVVAREIRRLADQTATATLDIDRIVQEMQSAVSAGVMEMDRFAEKVRRGVDEVERSSGRMSEIIGQVRENSDRFRAVSEGMAAQSAGATQISSATAHLQDAARTTVDGIARIAATVRDLERASASLRTSVSVFRLGDA